MSSSTRLLYIAVLLGFALACKSKPDASGDETGTASAPIETPKTPLGAPSNIASPPPEASRSESGLAWIVLQEGTGSERPRMWDTVVMSFVFRTPDGTEVGNSETGGGAVQGLINPRMVPGWREALSLMVVGDSRRYWIPGALAYGDKASDEPTRPGLPPGPLVLDIELLDVQRAVGLPEAPEDLGAPPKSARKTESGIAVQVLKEGSGAERLGPNDLAKAHYSGWTSEGELIGSTEVDGRPATLVLAQATAGWKEGLEGMRIGERRRLWVPEASAFAGQPGQPQGDLVYDVELLAIGQ